MNRLKLALAKGRLEKKTIELFTAAGLDCSAVLNPGRKLVLPIGGFPLDIVLAKAPDVITYVEHGVCDIGITGKDTILENGRSFYEVLDLGFGCCKFALAAPKGTDLSGGMRHLRIATKYPNVAKKYFNERYLDVEIIKIEGSVELAPLLGLADAIVDIVETGATLRENGLEVVDDITNISSRMIVNIAAMKMKKTLVESLTDLCSSVLELQAKEG